MELLSLGGNLGGFSLDRSLLFPDDPLDPDRAMLYGSLSGTGIRGLEPAQSGYPSTLTTTSCLSLLKFMAAS
jgi:hypothetical protein